MRAQGSATRAEFDVALQALVGRTITGVTYYEIAYADASPMWSSQGDTFDSLDFGLTLRLDDGSDFSFIWDKEFTQYNVSFRQGPLDLAGDERSWDATSRWTTHLGAPIVEVTPTWIPSEAVFPAYPQSVSIRFAPGRSIVISAFEFRDRRPFIGMTDHITVFFDESEARRLDLL